MKNPLLLELSVDRVREHIETITRTIPTRLAGSPNGLRMAQYSAQALRDAGVECVVEEFPGLVSFPEDADVRVVTPQALSLKANTLGHSVQTPEGGVRAYLVDTGSGDFSDYPDGGVDGRIALSELSYSPARQEKQRIAAINGASACLMMNWGHDTNTAIPFGSVKAAWGNPTEANYEAEMPVLPCVGISRVDGLLLRRMLRDGPVEIELETRVANEWRPVQMTVGEIPGQNDDFVVLGGHQDSWPGPQASDNANGSACILELARVFNRHRDKLRRGLVIGFWVGHETGTMIGSSRFVDQNWERLRDHAVAYLQIDQPSCAGTTTWHTSSNIELRRFHTRVEAETLPGRDISWSKAAKVGDASFFGLGVPMMAGQGAFTSEELKGTANATFGWWHHSLENDVDKISWDYMDAHLRTYASYLWELCTAVVLPFEFVSVAMQLRERLRELVKFDSGMNIARLVEKADVLCGAAQRLDDAAISLREAYDSGAMTKQEPAEAINNCFKRLSRSLIPIASTVVGTYGHDPYAFTPQGTVIPSLFDLPRLAKLPPGSDAFAMLEPQVLRARNKVGDVLDHTTEVIESTLRVVSSLLSNRISEGI